MEYHDEVYFHSTPEPEPAFSAEEYDARLDRIRTNVARRGIDMLLVMSPDRACIAVVGWSPCSGC